jgi:tetratricopeptide (TPR) repeat protein/predicted secreted protein
LSAIAVIIVLAMTRNPLAPLREAPTTVPALAAVGIFVAWATDQAGYPVTHWGPGGLILLALLGSAFGILGVRAREIPLAVRLALACLAAYTALSFLSILWARAPGNAWEGANRTLLYLAVFALFAGWRQRGASAALIVGVWTLAMIGLAAYVALHLDAAAGAELARLLPGGRLIYPSGYPNANAAQWLIAFWPAVLLARSERLPWALRGVLAGGAVLLAEVALLSQSRGSLYATGAMLVLVFALLPRRLRTFAVLVPVALGTVAAAPAVLGVGDRLRGVAVVPSTLHHAIAVSFAAALLTGLFVAAGAAIESRAKPSPSAAARIRRGLGAVALATLVVILAAGLVVAGNPITRIEHGWRSFKGGYGANSHTGSRLVSGLGSNRYDFYRVALDELAAHPLAGIGADNFQQQYLAHGRSDETPRYPHSVEVRTLAETGLIGALLALVGLGAALLAGARACRGRGDPLGADVAAAALGGFAYWAVHGSIDWFWEFAGLGAPAFALLGIACALAPTNGRRAATPAANAPAREPSTPGHRASNTRRGVVVVAGVLVVLGAIWSLAAPWLSQRQVERAASVWRKDPARAYARLEEAARLNPLSDEAYLVAGSIALRYGDVARADHEFSLALERVPGDAYATLERGAIASMSGRRADALRLLEAAVRLNPRDQLTREALLLVRAGKRVDVESLNRSILIKARQLA